MRILVVDDEAASLVELKAVLSSHGDCDAATSGTEALQLFQQAHADGRPYALVAMDIKRSEKGGQEAVAALRSWEKENGQVSARILTVTAGQDLVAVSKCIKSGSDGTLMKPFTPESVNDAVSALGLSRSKLGLKLKPQPPQS
jgi:two-component system, chemotaxis family, chemotaxis protein CheY